MVRDVPECEFRVLFDADGHVGCIEIRRIGESFASPARLHDVPFGEVIAKAREFLAPFHEQLAAQHTMVDGRSPDFAAWSASLRERPGRRGHDESHLRDLARVARAYEQLVVTEKDRAPLQTLADRLNLSYQRVRNIVHEARSEKLLTATKAGRAGGHLTAKANRILEGDKDGTR